MCPDSGSSGYGELHQEAVRAVEYALSLVPIRCLSDVDVAERAVNTLRDRLIMDLRQPVPSQPAEVLRAALERANVALSLIVGVEYPATGSQRKPLEMARDTLRAISW